LPVRNHGGCGYPAVPFSFWFKLHANLHCGLVCHESKERKFFEICINDGSRSTAYALEKEFANHLKVLCSKDMVLSVQVKGAIKGIR
jgi:hypothetical protein